MELSDEVIVLRPWREDDALAVYEACQDADILQWIPAIPRPYTLDHARAFVTGAVGLGPHQFAICEGRHVVGSIDIVVNHFGNGHIGYWCVRDARGRGVTTRALGLVCRYALEQLGLERLELIIDPENVPSRRVAEKVGFRCEGLLRSYIRHPNGRRRDVLMFSLLPGEAPAGVDTAE